jgi:protein-tyrosine phosphatase
LGAGAEGNISTLSLFITQMTSILFICTANQFRSVIAALYFAREVVRRVDDKNFSVGSAGTWAYPGSPATSTAIQIMEGYNLDLSFHKARLISSEIIGEADLILVMEEGHREGILLDYPEADGKIFLLTEAAGEPPVEIPDPYTTNAPAEEVAHDIVRLLDESYEKIIAFGWKFAKED